MNHTTTIPTQFSAPVETLKIHTYAPKDLPKFNGIEVPPTQCIVVDGSDPAEIPPGLLKFLEVPEVIFQVENNELVGTIDGRSDPLQFVDCATETIQRQVTFTVGDTFSEDQLDTSRRYSAAQTYLLTALQILRDGDPVHDQLVKAYAPLVKDGRAKVHPLLFEFISSFAPIAFQKRGKIFHKYPFVQSDTYFMKALTYLSVQDRQKLQAYVPNLQLPFRLQGVSILENDNSLVEFKDMVRKYFDDEFRTTVNIFNIQGALLGVLPPWQFVLDIYRGDVANARQWYRNQNYDQTIVLAVEIVQCFIDLFLTGTSQNASLPAVLQVLNMQQIAITRQQQKRIIEFISSLIQGNEKFLTFVVDYTPVFTAHTIASLNAQLVTNTRHQQDSGLYATRCYEFSTQKDIIQGKAFNFQHSVEINDCCLASKKIDFSQAVYQQLKTSMMKENYT